jgi:hypothetical protein
MAAYRFYNPAPVLMDLLGLQPCAGGSLAFYDQGTTTPRNTWSDSAQTILNTNPVLLDSSGRANTNIWLDGAYSVRLRDAAGQVVWTRDVNSGVTAGLVIPTPLPSGKYLTNDGSNLLWGDFFQLPDPTGSDGKVVVASDGGYVLQAQQTIPPAPVTADKSIRIGKLLDQWGVQTMPATNAQSASMSFSFPTPFVEVPAIQILITKGGPVVSEGFTGTIKASPSATAATVDWNTGVDDLRPGLRLTEAFQFSWRAVGKVEA